MDLKTVLEKKIETITHEIKFLDRDEAGKFGKPSRTWREFESARTSLIARRMALREVISMIGDEVKSAYAIDVGDGFFLRQDDGGWANSVVPTLFHHHHQAEDVALRCGGVVVMISMLPSPVEPAVADLVG